MLWRESWRMLTRSHNSHENFYWQEESFIYCERISPFCVTSRMWNSGSQKFLFNSRTRTTLYPHSWYSNMCSVCMVWRAQSILNILVEIISFLGSSSVFLNIQLVSLSQIWSKGRSQQNTKAGNAFYPHFLFYTLSHIVSFHNSTQSIEDPWPHFCCHLLLSPLCRGSRVRKILNSYLSFYSPDSTMK